jgi:hypothetical protein
VNLGWYHVDFLAMATEAETIPLRTMGRAQMATMAPYHRSPEITLLNLAQVFFGFCLALSVFYFYAGFGTFTAYNGVTVVTPAMLTIALSAVGILAFSVELLRGHVLRYPLLLLTACAAYLLFVAWSQISHPAEDNVWVLKRAGYAISLIGLIFMIGSLDSMRPVNLFLRAGVVLCCFMNVFDLLFGSHLPFMMSMDAGRAAGFFMNSNVSALRISFLVPLVCAGLSRPLCLAFYAGTGLAVLLTGSRGGFVLFGTAIFLSEMVLRREGPWLSRSMFIGLLLIAVAALLTFMWPSIRDLLRAAVGEQGGQGLIEHILGRSTDAADRAAEERVYAAGLAWEFFERSPLIGNGLGWGDGMRLGGEAHNMYLQTLAEFGAAGGAWLATFLVGILRSGPRWGFVCFVLWVVAAPFNHNLLDDPGMGLLVAPYVAMAARAKLRERAAKAPAKQLYERSAFVSSAAAP